KPSMDGALYREVVERIRTSGGDVLINLTTGPGARFTPDDRDPSKPGPESLLKSPADRVRHVVELKPDICSLDMGSLNMGDRVLRGLRSAFRCINSRWRRRPYCSADIPAWD